MVGMILIVPVCSIIKIQIQDVISFLLIKQNLVALHREDNSLLFISNIWNSLPANVAEADTIVFKYGLDRLCRLKKN